MNGQTILYQDESIMLSTYDGSGVVNAYRMTDYKTPLRGAVTRSWLCCGAWRHCIIGYREMEVYGREPRVVRDLSGIVDALNSGD